MKMEFQIDTTIYGPPGLLDSRWRRVVVGLVVGLSMPIRMQGDTWLTIGLSIGYLAPTLAIIVLAWVI